jgi:CheY-like chemotaxis protein
MAIVKAILLVDDEAILLLSLKQSLRLRFGPGYRYETAANGAEGLERVKELATEGVRVVLVISDWLMPGMKGDEFLARIHASNPDIKLIMLTGHADESDMAGLSRDVGLEAFIRKPWNAEDLFAIVESALSSDFAGAEGARA